MQSWIVIGLPDMNLLIRKPAYTVDELNGELPLLTSPMWLPKRGEGAGGERRKMRAGGFVSQLLQPRLVHALRAGTRIQKNPLRRRIKPGS